MKTSKLLAIVIAMFMLATLFALAGCNGAPEQEEALTTVDSTQETKTEEPATETTGEAAKEQYHVGVVLQTITHVFYQEMEAAMREKAAELGISIQVVSSDGDLATFVGQVGDFVQKKFDALIVCPPDSKGAAPCVQEAIDAGIPVFSVDIVVEGANVVSHVASNNIQGGNAAGLMMAEALGTDATGVCIVISADQASTARDRADGFIEVMAEKEPNVEIVKVPGAGQREEALKQVENSIQKYGDRIIAVFGIEDECALAAVSAIEAVGRLDVVKIIGFDANPQAQDAIKAGKMYGDVIQFPQQIGITGIQMVYDYLTGTNTHPDPVVPVATGMYKIDGIYDIDGNKVG